MPPLFQPPVVASVSLPAGGLASIQSPSDTAWPLADPSL